MTLTVNKKQNTNYVQQLNIKQRHDNYKNKIQEQSLKKLTRFDFRKLHLLFFFRSDHFIEVYLFKIGPKILSSNSKVYIKSKLMFSQTFPKMRVVCRDTIFLTVTV